MKYCLRCIYPENARPTILFDDDGICSGCRVQESKNNINWDERDKKLKELLTEYKERARENGSAYDCIIPVSGGKDSHYQVYLAKKVYGLNPLLVTYNHIYNTNLGIRNLRNLVKIFECDLIRFTSRADAVRKIDKYMLQKVGDITWHYHTGIYTFPFQVAVEKQIPLILWGEHGNSELTGMVSLEDIPEFTKWYRQQYVMRGVKVEQLIEENHEITIEDIAPFKFPTIEEIEDTGVRGIYLGTYVNWDHLPIAKKMVQEYNFKMYDGKRERTFSLFHKIDDHANAVHDYLKYLKFGYGRGTDHSCEEIRAGRMTREEGIGMAMKYDHVRPDSLDLYLGYLNITEKELLKWIEKLSDQDVWMVDDNGERIRKDTVLNHINDTGVEDARLPLVNKDDMTFGYNNRHFYYSDSYEPMSQQNDIFIHESVSDFIIL